MYALITTKCNMECAHCCQACVPGRGRDMSFEVFKAYCSYEDYFCTLGGDEPTMHPQFWTFLGYAWAHCYNVWMVTNGKITEIALALAELTNRQHGFECQLSQDYHHEPIDPKVVSAFSKLPSGIRSVPYEKLVNSGRCTWGMDECICEEPTVYPSGRVTFCGCNDSPTIGHILRGFLGYDDIGEDCCWKKSGFSRAEIRRMTQKRLKEADNA